jgi:predicted deacylase
VRHELAAADAERIVQYLAWRGLVDGAPAALPPLECEPTPLAGSIPLEAPHGGVVVFLRELGSVVLRGEPLVEIVDPLSGRATILESPTEGVFYARESRRFAVAGTKVAKVAGREAVRSGRLLSD